MKWNFKNYNLQNCLFCGKFLKLLDRYVMGGSCYYYFNCKNCNKYFNGSTYDFTLRETEQILPTKKYDKFINTLKHHF